MSSVANVMVLVGSRDAEGFARLNTWVAQQYEDRIGADRLRSLTEAPWGGTRVPEVHLFGAALDRWNLRALVDEVGRIPWQDPHLVQLFVCDQGDATFGVWMFEGALFEGAMFREVLPARAAAGDRAPFDQSRDDDHLDR